MMHSSQLEKLTLSTPAAPPPRAALEKIAEEDEDRGDGPLRAVVAAAVGGAAPGHALLAQRAVVLDLADGNSALAQRAVVLDRGEGAAAAADGAVVLHLADGHAALAHRAVVLDLPGRAAADADGAVVLDDGEARAAPPDLDLRADGAREDQQRPKDE